MTFGDVLQERMDPPKATNAREVSPERTKIFGEASVVAICEHWNEAVVKHALKGTQERICSKQPDGPLDAGKLRFTKNVGQVSVSKAKGKNRHKPDWCVYQEGQNNEKPINIVPGEIKPATKWKSKWIKSRNKQQKKKAMEPVQQLTKYMRLGQTRYGFLLTDEELVPVRLSKRWRDMEGAKRRTEQRHKLAMLADTAKWFDSEIGDSNTAASSFSQVTDTRSEASYADSRRSVDVVFEYISIPWAAHGANDLTVNLALWWLPMLAVQGYSIKRFEEYTSLGDRARGNSPDFLSEEAESQTDKSTDFVQAGSLHKRRRDEIEGEGAKPCERSKKRGRRREQDSHGKLIRCRTRSASSRATSESKRATGIAVVVPTARKSKSDRRSLRRLRRTDKSLSSSQTSIMTADTSQSIEGYQLSFSR